MIAYLVFNVIILLMIVYLTVYMFNHLVDSDHHIAALVFGALGVGTIIIDSVMSYELYKIAETPWGSATETKKVFTI